MENVIVPTLVFGWLTFDVSTVFLLSFVPSTPPHAARKALAEPAVRPAAANRWRTVRRDTCAPFTSRSRNSVMGS